MSVWQSCISYRQKYSVAIPAGWTFLLCLYYRLACLYSILLRRDALCEHYSMPGRLIASTIDGISCSQQSPHAAMHLLQTRIETLFASI